MISEETRQKMRIAKLGKTNKCLGTKRSLESKLKMSKSRIAYYKRIGGMSQETKDKLKEIINIYKLKIKQYE